MLLLFCNMEVKFEDIGEYMQKYIEKEGFSMYLRCLLVGGMKVEKMLFGILLLKWYLDYGLKVMCIYQVVGFNVQVCFKKFVNDVIEV